MKKLIIRIMALALALLFVLVTVLQVLPGVWMA